MTNEREIAIAIGHHFWECETDEQAARNGADAARDVMKRLEAIERDEANAIEDQDAYEDAVAWRIAVRNAK